ncbi:DUF4224 domain-containing protein [Burkholderia multivorans]|uniref:DUF4224 domain-containing protein n=1 Tax=Burkholderia multivorans TaxID=87883 RepID=UPI00158A5953|nr:DUF4224 domain-containing protein [Burkholderia multivorans]MCA8437455.1 DUF4224 domain-containing protein [Burkholderia multivorans]
MAIGGTKFIYKSVRYTKNQRKPRIHELRCVWFLFVTVIAMQNLDQAPSNPRSDAAHALPPFLTDAELRRIAEPLRQPAAIMRWFKRAGFEVKKKPNGMPLVSRAHFEQVMCGRAVASDIDRGAGDCSPDTAALLQRFARSNKRNAN